jgi:hypothetical protein
MEQKHFLIRATDRTVPNQSKHRAGGVALKSTFKFMTPFGVDDGNCSSLFLSLGLLSFCSS